jgi:imidazolonepropionase-like amidohydrolase
VKNAAEAEREVDTLKAAGADFVKVYDGLSPETYFAVAKEAKKTGLPIAGHVPSHVTILDATNAGQRSIEHAIELRGGSTAERELIDADMNRKEDLLAEAMRTGNFSLIPETIARDGNVLLDHLSQQRADTLYTSLVRNRTYLCPTLDVKEWLAYADDLAKKSNPRKQYVSPTTLHYWQPEVNMLTKYRTPAYIEFRKREYAAIRAQIPREQAAGVQFLAGTDLTVPFTYAGFSVHDEMALFVKAGLTPLQALQTATTHPVEFFGLQETMGSIAPGKLAELVVLDDNPLQDVRNSGKIAAVVTHGRLLRRPDLDALLKRAAESAQSDK